MSERVRYAWGQSSLGDFIAAIANEGLVAFEFMKRNSGVPAILRGRLPGAVVDLDEAGLADVVGTLAAVVERPDIDPGLRIDMRGSDYQKRVWGIVCRIPAGQTINYGAIAAEVGTPRDARDVTGAIANNTIAILIPCHRVVKKDGSLSGYRWGAKRKRALLAREQHQAGFRLVS
jgi:AraC family transcriptional regulator, regulatory protein of adaptative response / methylated-DNA-[protein]-cysteine methyltransferase